MSETRLYELECVLIALLAGAIFLAFVVRKLRRAQPGLAIGRAVGAAFGLRVLAVLALNQTSNAGQLRGGDELLFIGQGHSLARWSFASQASVDGLTKHFHTFFFSLNYRAFGDAPQTMLRMELIAIAVAGLALVSAAVYELAGSRPAVITAWVLAFEPANVFFSGILHKEPFMFVAEGLVAYGGARLWKRGDYRALVPMVIGCLLATATRPYVGWFLAAAAAVVALHAGLRRNSASGSLALAAVVVALIVAFFPTVWNASSQKSLHSLQQSQDANAADTRANLSLERVDYSTREKVILNLPKRMLDIVTKPYPWQVANASQRLGVFGTTFMFVGLILLAAALVQNGRSIMRRAGPLIYPILFLLVAYSLSAGNAGTAFRYRTHVVALLVALLVVLRSHRLEEHVARTARPLGKLQPVLTHGQTT